MMYSFGNSTNVQNETLSYNVVGTPTINGSQFTEVNFSFTGSGSESSQGQNLTILAFLNPQGNVTIADYNGQNFTGVEAAAFSGAIVLPFSIFISYQQGLLRNFSQYANFQNTGTSQETYGHLTLPVTTYTATSFTYQNFTATSATIKVGHLPNSNLDITTLISVTGATGAGVKGIENFQYALISATQG